jgi:phosphate transport system substrate-binding protein
MATRHDREEETALETISTLDEMLELRSQLKSIESGLKELETENRELRARLSRSETAESDHHPRIQERQTGRKGKRNQTVVIVVVLPIVLLIAALGWNSFHRTLRRAETQLDNGLGWPGAVILRLHGSNTIGSELAPDLIEGFLRAQGVPSVERLVGPGSNEWRLRAKIPGEPRPSIVEIQADGSETGFADLLSGAADIGMSSRRITAQEVGQLSKLGDMTSLASEHIIGIDGVAVIVNPSNPVSSLSTSDLANIFECRIANWSGVGGAKAPIHLFRRNNESGTYKTIRDLVLNGREICSNARVVQDSKQLSNLVAADPDAIGFIGLPYVGSSKALAIADEGARALVPNPITVGTEEYALSRRLWLYTPAKPQNSWVSRFVEFTLSPAGQALVSRDGFAGQNIVAAPNDIPLPNTPDKYLEFTTDAERLSLDFRFESAGTELDSKGMQDVVRLASFLQEPEQSDKKLMLFGFADPRGNSEWNCQLSQSRAETVAAKLRLLGVKARIVRGFCDDLPLGSSSTAGRSKSRRVEVWIK